MLLSYISVVQLSEWRNVSTSVLTKLQTSFGFHQILFFFFLTNVLFCSRLPSRAPQCISSSHLLSLFLADSCSVFFVFPDLHIWQGTGQASAERPLHLGLADVFSWPDCGYGFRRKPRRWRSFLTHHAGEHMLSTGPVPDGADLDHLARVLFARFLHHQETLPFHTPLSRSEWPCAVHTPRGESLSSSWRRGYPCITWSFPLGRLISSPPFTYLFRHLFTQVWPCRYFLDFGL